LKGFQYNIRYTVQRLPRFPQHVAFLFGGFCWEKANIVAQPVVGLKTMRRSSSPPLLLLVVVLAAAAGSLDAAPGSNKRRVSWFNAGGDWTVGADGLDLAGWLTAHGPGSQAPAITGTMPCCGCWDVNETSGIFSSTGRCASAKGATNTSRKAHALQRAAGLTIEPTGAFSVDFLLNERWMLPGSLESAATMLEENGWTGLAIDNENVVNSAPPASPGNHPTKDPTCQETLDAICNNASVNAACLTGLQKDYPHKGGGSGANASVLPLKAMFDRSPSSAANAWRCYSRRALDAAGAAWSSTAELPAAFCTMDRGVRLDTACAPAGAESFDVCFAPIDTENRMFTKTGSGQT
jgi:hypothetical protein